MRVFGYIHHRVDTAVPGAVWNKQRRLVPRRDETWCIASWRGIAAPGRTGRGDDKKRQQLDELPRIAIQAPQLLGLGARIGLTIMGAQRIGVCDVSNADSSSHQCDTMMVHPSVQPHPEMRASASSHGGTGRFLLRRNSGLNSFD